MRRIEWDDEVGEVGNRDRMWEMSDWRMSGIVIVRIEVDRSGEREMKVKWEGRKVRRERGVIEVGVVDEVGR